MITKIMYPVLLLISGLPAGAQETEVKKEDAFHFEASYAGDNVNNIHGGVKTGSCYLGMANLKIGFNSEKAGMWKGGQLFVNAVNTHGNTPSQNYIGDLQVTSNIEAGDHTYVQELWAKQTLGAFELTAGLQDLNVQFVNTEFGGLYLNSSFGVNPTISGNIPAPIFPLTTLGFSTRWAMSEHYTLLAAVFDGSPTDFDQNPYNMDWHFNHGDGILAIAELQIAKQIAGLPGCYKVGAYSHNHYLESTLPSDSDSHNNYGFYFNADQTLWENAPQHRRVGMFAQLSGGPQQYNDIYLYVGGGMNYYGIFNKRGRDVLGVAFANAQLKNNLGNETTIELTYRVQLSDHIYLQPDLQYVMNPVGLGQRLNNCMESTVRLGLFF
jgi:porin